MEGLREIDPYQLVGTSLHPFVVHQIDPADTPLVLALGDALVIDGNRNRTGPSDGSPSLWCLGPTADLARLAGLATDLLNGLVRLLGPYGVNRLCLDVAADNGAATAFYESSGFLADGRRRNYYERSDGTQVDAVLMSRSIAGQANESEA